MDSLRRMDPVLSPAGEKSLDATGHPIAPSPSMPQPALAEAIMRSRCPVAGQRSAASGRCPFAATSGASAPQSHSDGAGQGAKPPFHHDQHTGAASDVQANPDAAGDGDGLPATAGIGAPPAIAGEFVETTGGGCPFMRSASGLPSPADQLTHRELQTFMRLLPDAVFVVNPRGVVFDCNAHAMRMFGYPRSRLVGHSIEQLVPPQFHGMHAGMVRGSFMRNEVREMGARKGVRGRHAKGHMLDLSITLSPFTLLPPGPINVVSPPNLATGPFWVDPAQADVAEGDGRLVTLDPEHTSFMLCVVRDLTDRTRLIVSSQRALNRAQLMDGFLRLINHETRTSLNSIQHAIRELSEQIDKETAEEEAQHAANVAAAASCSITSTPPVASALGVHPSAPSLQLPSASPPPVGSVLSPVGEFGPLSSKLPSAPTLQPDAEHAPGSHGDAPIQGGQWQQLQSEPSTRRSSWCLTGTPGVSAPPTPYQAVSRGLSIASSTTTSPQMMSPRRLSMSSVASTPSTDAFGSPPQVDGSAGESHRSSRQLQLRSHLAVVQSAADRMGILLGNMLDLQHLQSGSMIETIATFDPKNMLVSVCHAMEKLAASQGVQLQCFAADGLPSVTGNAELLSKCLLSLTDNAIKASRPGQRVVLRCQLGKTTAKAKAEATAASFAAEAPVKVPVGATPRRVEGALLTEVASSSFHYAPTPPGIARTLDDQSILGSRRLRLQQQPSSAVAASPATTAAAAANSIELFFQVLDQGSGFEGLAIERLPPPLPLPAYAPRKGKHPTNDARAAEEAEAIALAAASHQLPAHRVIPPSPQMSIDASVPVCADALALSSQAEADDVASLDVSTTRGTKNGLGLGISIARLAVRGLNGTFQIISQPRKDKTEDMSEQQKLERGLNAPENSSSSPVASKQPGLESPPNPVCRSQSAGSHLSAPLCLCMTVNGIGTELCGPCLLASRWTSISQLSAPFTRCAVQHPILADTAQRDALQFMRDPSTARMRSEFHILVVEDNDINARILTRILARGGFTHVTRAANGQLALQAITDKAAHAEAYNQQKREELGVGATPDVALRSLALGAGSSPESASAAASPASVSEFHCILMDIEMPVMDGFTATETIRAQGADSLPIIALTANATLDCQRRCKKAGMNVFLTKPINADSLIFTLAAMEPFNLYPMELSPFFLRAHAE